MNSEDQLAAAGVDIANNRIARAEAALAPYRAARAAATQDLADAAAEAAQLGLPGASAALDELADRLADAAATRRVADDRASRLTSLTARREATATALAAALAERREPSSGEPASGDLRAALARYEQACRDRAEQAGASARREPLQQQIAARRAAEGSARATLAAIAVAERRLLAAAASVGLAGGRPPEQLVDGLRAWQRERSERLQQDEAALAEWQRLQALLDGRPLAELRTRADEASGLATRLAERLGEAVAAPGVAIPDIEAGLTAARQELMAASSEADALRGNLEARREALPDVAEAEEAVATVGAELERVQALATTLQTTLGLLRAAEERVHRSLAPVLAASIVRWLPSVSGGAYEEVTVDPADLSVRAKEAKSGKWREARLLSEGTREQIYLLLRVAMAEHLVTNGETAPLLLDEVTVQSDPERKRQLLSVLHALSAERQVVIFTHDDDVVAWADAHLDAERDATVRLAPRTSLGEARAFPVEANESEPIAAGNAAV